MAPATGTQAVDRAAGLLLAVLESPEPVSFGDLQETSGLAKSTLSRLLSSLERHELIAKADDGTLRPGSALVRFAHSRRPTDELIEATRPFLDALSDATGEKVNLAILDAGEVQQIHQIECTYLIGGVTVTDQPIALHASALGKVFLAHGAELPPGRLAKVASRTITSREKLAQELDVTRERGWALADSELEDGLIAVAAPLFATDGSVVAAISITGPTLRMTREVAKEYGALLVEVAGRASAALGYSADSEFNDSDDSMVTPIGGRVGAA